MDSTSNSFVSMPMRLPKGAADDVKKEIPGAVKDEVKKQLPSNQVEITIEKQSLKKAQKAIEDLFNPFKRWKK